MDFPFAPFVRSPGRALASAHQRRRGFAGRAVDLHSLVRQPEVAGCQVQADPLGAVGLAGPARGDWRMDWWDRRLAEGDSPTLGVAVPPWHVSAAPLRVSAAQRVSAVAVSARVSAVAVAFHVGRSPAAGHLDSRLLAVCHWRAGY